ncbi:MAG: tetratricopeptide repeat protein [Patescibacteria group bacterium]
MKDLDMNVPDDVEVVLENMTDTPEERGEGGEGVSYLMFFKRKIPFIESLSFVIFLATIIITLVGFLPSSNLPLDFFKKEVFTGGILLAFALWLITRLEDGRFVFPGGLTLWSSLGIIGSTGISAILAPSVLSSIFGVGYEQDTLVATTIFFIALFLSSTYFESRKRLFYFYSSFFVIMATIAVVEVIQLFSEGSFLTGGMLSNLIGKWYDLGIFFGLGIVLSLAALELFELTPKMKKLFTVLLVTSVLIMAVVNYNFLWMVVGVLSLVVYIYKLSFDGLLSNLSAKAFIRPSFIVLVLSAILFFGAGIAGETLKTRYNIYPFEIRPSWQATVDITRNVVNKTPWFGSGPNTFSLSWASFKPVGVNDTQFWGTDFSVGYGRVVSSGVTLGLVGLISWALFVFSLLYLGLRAAFARFEDSASRSIVFTSGLTTLYLWFFSVFYVTDTAILALTFIFTGIFMAVLAKEGLVKNYEFSFLKDYRLGFVSVLLVIVLLVATVSVGYLMGRKYLALDSYQKGLYAINISGDIAVAEKSLINAIGYDEQDLYYRVLSGIEIARLRQLFNNTTTGGEQLIENIKSTLSQASGTARRAVDLNKSNYLNWMALGYVGEVVVPIKSITDAYKLASESYTIALGLNQNNPAIDLALARLEIANSNPNKAKDYINYAIQKKSNFTEAYFLLSQIYSSQGNIKEGIAKAEQAALFSPEDAGVQFQLGFLKYLQKDYSGATTALTKATVIQQNYSNAKYFLGLSYSKLGKVTEAIKEFLDIANFNPDNQEVKEILKNLRAGRGALDGLGSSGSQPEKRDSLPIKER